MSELTVPRDEVKQKLNDLRSYMTPREFPEQVFQFGVLLAEGYLNVPDINPNYFLQRCEAALYDLKRDRLHEPKSVQQFLREKKPHVYESLNAQVPYIAVAIFQSDFADKVREVWRSFNLDRSGDLIAS